jgi:two-component system NtrC family sensor kinase
MVERAPTAHPVGPSEGTETLVSAQLESAEPRIVAAFVALQALMLAGAWGHWRTEGYLVADFAAAVLINNQLMPFLRRHRLSPHALENFRMAVNTVLTAMVGHLFDWSLPSVVYVVSQILVQGLFDTRWVRLRVALVVATLSVMATFDGAPAINIASMVVGSIAGFLFVRFSTEAMARVVSKVESQRQELETANARLQSMQGRAIQQEKLAGLGMLAAGVAHEINNPMAFIGSNVASLARELSELNKDPELMREYVEEVLPETVKGIARVNAIVSDLRRFARGDPETFVAYNLNEEIEGALRIAHNQLKHRCEVKKDLRALPPLQGMPRQISQVFVNLLVNAAQAIKGEGTITLSSQRIGDEVRVSIADTGGGMSPEVQQRLFEPFFTTKPVGEGTGLGLSVVHGIVETHGGRIEVESQLGRGSKFTLHLPIAAPMPSAPAAAVAAPALAVVQS